MVSQVIKYLTYAILQQSWKTSVLYWSYSRGGGCNQLQVHLPHLYLLCSLWTRIRLALTLESITNNSPTHGPSIPHSPPQFFFGAVGKVKVYTWNPILQQDSLEFLIFGPKLLYDMLVIGPKDTTIALKKKTNTWDHCCERADTGEESTHGFLYTEWLRHACLSPCMIVKFWTVHFFKLKCFRVWIGSETLVHFKKRMVKSFYYHNSTPPQWKPPGLSGLW